jgi:hypothetical protein
MRGTKPRDFRAIVPPVIHNGLLRGCFSIIYRNMGLSLPILSILNSAPSVKKSNYNQGEVFTRVFVTDEHWMRREKIAAVFREAGLGEYLSGMEPLMKSAARPICSLLDGLLREKHD